MPGLVISLKRYKSIIRLLPLVVHSRNLLQMHHIALIVGVFICRSGVANRSKITTLSVDSGMGRTCRILALTRLKRLLSLSLHEHFRVSENILGNFKPCLRLIIASIVDLVIYLNKPIIYGIALMQRGLL